MKLNKFQLEVGNVLVYTSANKILRCGGINEISCVSCGVELPQMLSDMSQKSRWKSDQKSTLHCHSASSVCVFLLYAKEKNEHKHSFIAKRSRLEKGTND